MCGIVGLIGKAPVTERLIEGLRRLEYRGYDSAGLAVQTQEGDLQRRRAPGKIAELEKVVQADPVDGDVGIAHTRWATHGKPTCANAHPHASQRVQVVHNGIIENHGELRQELQRKGYTFQSETDTEVIAHLIDSYLEKGESSKEDPKKALVRAVHNSLQRLKGAYALGVLSSHYPDTLVGARLGSPLAIGYGDGEMYLGSDAIALSHLSQKISFLEEGDLVELTRDTVTVYDGMLQEVERLVVTSDVSSGVVDKGGYPHFMLKEIFEQPDVVRRLLQHYVTESETLDLGLPFDWADVPKITLVACGTAYYAGFMAKHWFERFAKMPVEVDIASEFRYRQPPLPTGGVAIFLSQSGETADTLAALKYAKAQGQICLGILNGETSSIAREVDCVLPIKAGVEIGVASTKAFMGMVVVLGLLLLDIARSKEILSKGDCQDLLLSLRQLPSHLEGLLKLRPRFTALGEKIAKAQDVLYLGRGTSHGLALEGALKLKEISYIHAEGYAAGEMKHGPIALIDSNVPIVAIAPWDELFDKTISNIEEAMAREGHVILLSDEKGHQEFGGGVDSVSDPDVHALHGDDLDRVTLPESNFLTAPLLYTIPIQLLAYEASVARGENVDQPRNLAKSVTVE